MTRSSAREATSRNVSRISFHMAMFMAFLRSGRLRVTVTTPPARSTISVSMAVCVNGPGDQAVTVPSGTYTGGTVNTAHPATAGPYKGWLVLVAQTRGGVTVDLSTTNLTLGPSTSRVLFVGFKFVNGMFVVQ